jgi:hypothetical protein
MESKHVAWACLDPIKLAFAHPRPMDFSQMNSAEQAHMSKVIEKKQVK